MQKIWRTKKPDMALSQSLALQLKIPTLIAQLLVNRGITDGMSADNFLHPNISQLHPPDKMLGIAESVLRIHQAIKNHEKIVIYGDYDVDGITSTCLMYLCLKHLDADVSYYIPRRFEEGYGLNNESLAELKRQGCDLLITVDCGISSIKEVTYANESGIQVIITDHHEPSQTIPPAYAIINPKLKNSEYPFDALAGVGVAFKLAQALMDDFGVESESFLLNHLDLVALGTLADIVPLTGENRIIAFLGLNALNKSERAGIKALCAVSGVAQGSIGSWTVGFQLAPRLNAAGRMNTPLKAVELMLADSYEKAYEIAQKLDNANKERQSIERLIVDNAKKQVEQLDLEKLKALVLADKGWHSGIIGIAASKIQELFYRPTVLIAIEDDMGRGSARSIPEFDIHEAIEKCSSLLERFGGHKAAAGFTIRKENIEKFRNDFLKIASDTLTKEDLQSKLEIDVSVSLSDLSLDVVEMLSSMEPYGLGNPQPLIAVNGLSINGLPRVVGKGNEHLQAYVTDEKIVMKFIAFNMAKLERELSAKDVKVDLACRPSINSWNERNYVDLKIEDIIIHQHKGAEEVTIASDEIVDLTQIKIMDRRNIPNKKQYLQKLISKDERMLLYVRDDPAIGQLNKIV
ncbi:MAG: single-stranded-DNA-specific exonuclease, partial [Candidatus Poribacteria bacterium]|nr:single-stranded-DNA-specific exonuclease [Candidatus Poribacteria bacterium]